MAVSLFTFLAVTVTADLSSLSILAAGNVRFFGMVDCTHTILLYAIYRPDCPFRDLLKREDATS